MKNYFKNINYYLTVILLIGSCMNPIIEENEQYSDYSSDKFHDPDQGWPNGGFADGFDGWGGIPSASSTLEIDSTGLGQNSDNNNVCKITTLRGSASIYTFFSYTPGDTLVYTFHYMIPEETELNDNSSGFHINVNYSGDDINGNWLDRVDFVYSIDSDNINEKLIADGNWRPVTVPVVMRNSDAVGIWFNVGVAEYSFWDANYSEEREIIAYFDDFSITRKDCNNPKPSDFSIIYPNDGDAFNLDTIQNFQTIPFNWEESFDSDTVHYTNKLVANVPCNNAPISSGFEDYEILQRVGDNNEIINYKMPNGISNNFWNGSGNWLEMQSDFLTEFTVWVADSISRSGSHSLRMGASNLANASHYTSLWLRLSQVQNNLDKDRIVPGSEVTVRGYMMTPSSDKLTGENTASIMLSAFGDRWVYSASPVMNSSYQADEWHYFEVTMTVPERVAYPNTSTLLLLFRYNEISNNTGSVYFDDITVSTSNPITYVVTDFYDVMTNSTSTIMSADYLNNLFSFIRQDLTGISFNEADFNWGILATDNVREVHALNSPITFKVIEESSSIAITSLAGVVSARMESSEKYFYEPLINDLK